MQGFCFFWLFLMGCKELITVQPAVLYMHIDLPCKVHTLLFNTYVTYMQQTYKQMR